MLPCREYPFRFHEFLQLGVILLNTLELVPFKCTAQTGTLGRKTQGFSPTRTFCAMTFNPTPVVPDKHCQAPWTVLDTARVGSKPTGACH